MNKSVWLPESPSHLNQFSINLAKPLKTWTAQIKHSMLARYFTFRKL